MQPALKQHCGTEESDIFDDYRQKLRRPEARSTP